jgi:serine/threonine protein kinase/Tol biopolymer transport system component
MTLSSGVRLGPYEILSPLGAGGMGEVYRAKDTRLDRDVAIKVLSETFARDPERVARFQREAKLLASLNHPTIAAIYGFEEHNDIRFLVLELVEGPTLAERLRSGPMPVDESLDVCKQIAEAVEAAHEHGVIHRDLKPGNVKITPEGKVKVLDFGLAKALAEDASTGNLANSPTITVEYTRPGVVLGTAAFMSPEQARGKPLDKRTDIWSFGCVLYECLVGLRPFDGETTTDVIGAILHKEPDWSRVPPQAPPPIRLLLRRCLAKDRNRRLHDIADARIELEQAVADPTLSSSIGAMEWTTTIRRPGLWTRGLPWAFAAVAILAAALMGWQRNAGAPKSQVIRFTDTLSPNESVVVSDAPVIAVSPDGTLLAYVAAGADGERIHLRRLDSLESKPLQGTEGAQSPFFSPDGKWLGFAVEGAIKKIAVDGGVPFAVAPLGDNPRGAGWASDGSIVFTPSTTQGLVRLPATGGAQRTVTSLDAEKNERTHRWPQVLPGGQAAIYTVGSRDSPENYEDARIEAVSLDTGKRTVLFEGASMARYVPPGYLLCARKGTLMAMPFDAQQLTVTGSPFPALSGVLMTRNSGAAHFAVSESGTLVYIPGREALAESTLVYADRDGTVHELGVASGAYSAVSLSPDGTRLAVVVESQHTNDIWVINLTDAGMTRLTFKGQNLAPTWTPDGKRIAYPSARSGGPLQFYWKPADGSGDEEVLLAATGNQMFPCSWSPDGKTLVFEAIDAKGDGDLWVLNIGPSEKARPLVEGPETTRGGTVSPNGRWLAYQSDESGRYEVYVQDFPGPGGKWQISRDGGREPRWAADGKELFFPNGDRLMVAAVETNAGFRAGTPGVLFEGFLRPVTGAGDYRSYSVSPDARRFYMIKPSEKQARPTQINVVVNWAAELKK